jgi:hypothetical protein
MPGETDSFPQLVCWYTYLSKISTKQANQFGGSNEQSFRELSSIRYIRPGFLLYWKKFSVWSFILCWELVIIEFRSEASALLVVHWAKRIAFQHDSADSLPFYWKIIWKRKKKVFDVRAGRVRNSRSRRTTGVCCSSTVPVFSTSHKW